ncbi:hypothetical protein M8J76_002424 [Diaphorina citri]|nr:hypothetical protein M8J76_002424 [Diaphorina citri]
MSGAGVTAHTPTPPQNGARWLSTTHRRTGDSQNGALWRRRASPKRIAWRGPLPTSSYGGRNVFPALTPTSPPEKRRDAKTNTAEPSRQKETTGMSGTPRGARGIVACHKCSAAPSKG